MVIGGRDAERVDNAKDEVIALVKGLGGEPVGE